MPLDDLVLSAQHAIDRTTRRFRRGASPPVTQKRLLIIQIDGLSRAVLQHAIEHRRMPFVKRLLNRGGYRMEPMSVGLPTSTPAFQMATMYGVRPDIPGFHYYSRERQGDVHFPRSGHAAWVEKTLAGGRKGILDGGSAYGCCFTGGANNNLFTFASLTKPSGRGLLSALSPYVVLNWVVVKNLGLTAYELARALPRFVAHPSRTRHGWRWVWMKIGISIWVRNFFTMSASRDLYAGAPAIYVNYLDYDEAAHAFGPRSARALQSLRGIDRAIRHLWRVMERVPEHRYEGYILADHGQTPCTPYGELTKGKRLERWIFDEFLHPVGAKLSDTARSGLGAGIHARRLATTGLLQQFMNYLDEDYFRREDPEAYEKNGFRAISAGPNAFLYDLRAKAPLDADALETRFPGLADKLSRSPGIGFVLARSSNGKPDGSDTMCFWQGKRCALNASQHGPFTGREDAALVVEGIANLMKMPSAGDLVIYGTDATSGHVSFLSELGSHAGPSATEMQTFILRPAGVTLPKDITHPVQLYNHFIRYQDAMSRAPGKT
jgi:hypothetical protein